MSRRYQDLVDVRLGDPAEHRVKLQPGWRRSAQPVVGEVPTLFLWKGQVHVVREVLAQWSQRTAWWRQAAAEGSDQQAPEGAVLEQQVWRVEASAGRMRGSGIYDLVQGSEWLLERVSD